MYRKRALTVFLAFCLFLLPLKSEAFSFPSVAAAKESVSSAFAAVIDSIADKLAVFFTPPAVVIADAPLPNPPLNQGEGDSSPRESGGVNQILNYYNSYPTYISNPATAAPPADNPSLLALVNAKFQQAIDYARGESRSSVSNRSNSIGLSISDVRQDLSHLDQSLTVSGDVTANSYYGDGSHLTGINAGSSFSTSSTRVLFSSSAPGLTYASSTGDFSLTSGYAIPTSASTTDWNSKVSSQFTTNGSSIYYNGGNVGIGTSNPQYLLDLGNAYIDTDGSTSFVGGNFTISGNGNFYANSNSEVGGNFLIDGFTTLNGGFTSPVAQAGIDSEITFQSGTSNIGTSSFPVNLNVFGNVGVGTTTSSAKLSVVGSGNNIQNWYDNGGVLAASVDPSGYLGVSPNLASGQDYTFADNIKAFYGGANSIISAGGVFADSGLYSISRHSGLEALYVQGIDSSTNVMQVNDYQGHTPLIVKGNGNVGIGTTTPGYLLTVAGTANFATSSAVNLQGGASSLSVDANGNIIKTPSDRNLKENIQDLEGSSTLDKVLQLQGVSYDFKDKNFAAGPQIGFIAQDVQKIFPEVVSTGGSYWSLNYGNLVAAVVEAVKALAGKVSAMADYFQTKEVRTDKLCVGTTCVTQDQFLKMVEKTGETPAPTSAPSTPTEATSSEATSTPTQEATSTEATSTVPAASDDTNEAATEAVPPADAAPLQGSTPSAEGGM